MNHIAPEGGYCLTASALVFSAEPAARILLHQHKRYPVVIQPGGHVETDEHPWVAVLRELREEAGIVPEQLVALTPLEIRPEPGHFPAPVALDVHELEPGRRHTDLVFAFVIDGAPSEAPAEGESGELLWLTLAEAADDERVPLRIVSLAEQVVPQLETWPRIAATAVGHPRPRAAG
jgi:8-oxo-dGTP pyrophosphatase MutT (NUDIX family)